MISKLDDCLKHYESLELEIQKRFEVQWPQFTYDPNMEFERINSLLGHAVDIYVELTGGEDEATKTTCLEIAEKGIQVGKLMEKLKEDADASANQIQSILQSFSTFVVSPANSQALKWSSSLKHPNVIREEPNLIRKIAGEYTVFALLNRPLQATSSWKIKIVDIKNWIGIGVIS